MNTSEVPGKISIDEVEVQLEVQAENKRHEAKRIWEMRLQEYNGHIADGKSRNHAWHLAYKMYPKED